MRSGFPKGISVSSETVSPAIVFVGGSYSCTLHLLGRFFMFQIGIKRPCRNTARQFWERKFDTLFDSVTTDILDKDEQGQTVILRWNVAGMEEKKDSFG